MCYKLSIDGVIPYKFFGVVDADYYLQDMSPAFTLFGKYCPEKQVIEDISKSYSNELAVALFLTPDIVKKELEDIQTVSNYREWLYRLANKFNLSEQGLWNNMARLWVLRCLPLNEARKMIDAIGERLETA